MKRKLALVAVLLALGGATRTRLAHAQETEGLVMSVDHEFVVIDVGTTRGVANGDVVEVWRPMKIKHPVTGKIIVDRFRIGRLKITQARPNVSVAKPDGELERPMLAGDVVIAGDATPPIPKAVPVPTPSPTPTPTPKAESRATTTVTTTTKTEVPEVAPAQAAPPIDVDAKQIEALFKPLHGATPEKRIAAYKKFVLEHPQNAHVEVIWNEAKDLEKLVARQREDAERAADVPVLLAFDPPKTAPANVPLTIAVEVARARGAILHVRREGEPSFRSSPMRDAGAGYFLGTIAEGAMKEGTLEYFVEASSSRGEMRAIAGGADHPFAVRAEDPIPPDTTQREKTPLVVTASVLTDYASFNMKKDNDTMWQTEGQLGVRFRDVGLRALRSGFGVYRGKGGTLEQLDVENLSARRVGLTYGYLELETAFTPSIALVGRAIVGLREEGVSGGAQGFIRIGNDRKTNIMFGGEVLGGIGVRGITQVEIHPLPRLPVTLRSEVTNQPAGLSRRTVGPDVSTGQGEVGVRSIVQVGYRLLPNLVLAGRVSFQARTINHAGPGGGAAVMYEW